MNFFRSEEHIRHWVDFDPATKDGMIPLNDLLRLFSCEYFKKRLEPDYFSKRLEYRSEIMATLKEIGKTGPFWEKPG